LTNQSGFYKVKGKVTVAFFPDTVAYIRTRIWLFLLT